MDNSEGSVGENQENEEENLMGEDFALAMVKSLLSIQSNVVTLPGGKEHYDIYLAKQLYPVLVPALEELSREIARFTEQQGKQT